MKNIAGRRRAVWFLGAGLVAALAVSLAIGPRSCSVSTSRASRTMLDCMVRSDAGCLYGFIGAEERQKGGVDPLAFARFVAVVWKPAINGFQLHATTVQQGYGPSHLDRAELRHADGRRLPVASLAVRADDVAIHPNLVLDMTLTALLATRRASQPLPAGAGREEFYAAALGESSTALEASGLRGATVSIQGTGLSKFYTWAELADRFQRRATLFRRLPTLGAESREAEIRAYKDWESAGL